MNKSASNCGCQCCDHVDLALLPVSDEEIEDAFEAAALRAKLGIAVKALSDALNGVNREECFKVYKELRNQVGVKDKHDRK